MESYEFTRHSELNERYEIQSFYQGMKFYRIYDLERGKRIGIIFDRLSAVENWAEEHLLRK